MDTDLAFAIVSNVIGTPTAVAGIALELRSRRQRRRAHLRLLRIELVRFDEAACELAQAQFAAYWHGRLGDEKTRYKWVFQIQRRQLHLRSARSRLRRVIDYEASPAWVYNIEDTDHDATSIVCHLHPAMMRAKFLIDFMLSFQASGYESNELWRSDRPPEVLRIESLMPPLRKARGRVREIIAGAGRQFPSIPPADLAAQVDRALDEARAQRLAVELAIKEIDTKRRPRKSSAEKSEPPSNDNEGA